MKIVLTVLVVLIIAAGGFFILNQPPKVEAPTDGVSNGNQEEPGEWTNPYPEEIQVTMPKPNETVTQKFGVTGKARGFWYFEANLPMKLTEPDGTLIVQTYTTAQTEWMTEDYVPFSAVIDAGSYTGPALLVIMRDNPSGLPEHDKSISIPVVIE